MSLASLATLARLLTDDDKERLQHALETVLRSARARKHRCARTLRLNELSRQLFETEMQRDALARELGHEERFCPPRPLPEPIPDPDPDWDDESEEALEALETLVEQQ